MATKSTTNIWDAICSCSAGIIILLICLGIGSCRFLDSKGAAELKKAGVSEKLVEEHLKR